MASKVVAYDADALYAEAMIEGIKRELPDAAFFTREDLLHLSCFAHVSTITRYRYACTAARYAIDHNWMLEISRTELILTGGKRKYAEAVANTEEYNKTITKLVPRKGTAFTVASLLNTWTTDHHLTENTKRIYIRMVVQQLLRREYIQSAGLNIYEKV